jgi:hypothetical protein
MSIFCFVIAGVLFGLMGLDVITGPKQDDIFEFASMLVAAGLAFGGHGYQWLPWARP